MEISVFELKILRYILFHTKRGEITTNTLKNKFGDFCTPSIENLYAAGFIDCAAYSDNEQINIPSMDNWSITEKGKCCVENNRLVTALSARERLFNYFLGFGSGLLSGCIIQLFVKLLQ